MPRAAGGVAAPDGLPAGGGGGTPGEEGEGGGRAAGVAGPGRRPLPVGRRRQRSEVRPHRLQHSPYSLGIVFIHEGTFCRDSAEDKRIKEELTKSNSECVITM